MKKEYKEFILGRLYGLIEGTPKSLEIQMNEDFLTIFKFNPDLIKVLSTDRVITDEYLKGIWIGTMTAILVINGEHYSHTIDYGEAYDNDVKHPDFKTDDWFYETDKSFNYNQYNKELNKLLNIG